MNFCCFSLFCQVVWRHWQFQL